MGQKIVQVDSFTAEPFKGNPAGVCILEGASGERWMQNVALEMNLSETAFLYPGNEGYHLRWFTPAAEVELCGHATLASAHVLWEDGHVDPDEEIHFYTRSGELIARKSDNWIELDFPATPAVECESPEGLDEALGITPIRISCNKLDYLAELESEEAVRNLKPDFNRLKQLPSRGYIVSARSNSEPYDFVSRFFVPSLGIDEDPVTGAAHCVLGPYWKDQLGKSEFLAYQASARGGEVRVHVKGNRVLLGGKAVTVMHGELTQPPSP